MLNKIKNTWKMLGPGLITGAADDDPSGVATYSQAGAVYGFKFLWLAPLSFPLMAIIQEMCARIGLVTGRGLSDIMREKFPKVFLYIAVFLLFVANSFNIGADLGAMAEASMLILPHIPFIVYAILFTLISVLLQILIPYKTYVSYIKYLTLALFAYIITGFIIDMPWIQVFQDAVIPQMSFSYDEILLVCAILGTTISPYLFFWAPSQEVEEEINDGNDTIEKRVNSVDETHVRRMRGDVWFGMFFSNLVMFFIIAVCAATLNMNGITEINTARDAAEALRPIAGDFTYYLFTLGILGTGLLAIPVLAGSSAYALSELFKKEEGLYKTFKEAEFFYVSIAVSVVIGFIMNLTGIDAMKTLFYSAVLNGVVAPIMIVFILLIARDSTIMGKWVNTRTQNIIGWIVCVLMFGVGALALMGLMK